MIKFNDDFETKSAIAIREERNKLEKDFHYMIKSKVLEVLENHPLREYPDRNAFSLVCDVLDGEDLEYYKVVSLPDYCGGEDDAVSSDRNVFSIFYEDYMFVEVFSDHSNGIRNVVSETDVRGLSVIFAKRSDI